MLKQILRNFDDGSSVDLAKHLKLHGDAISRVDAALLRLCTGIAWLDSADPPAGVFAEILGEAEANSGAADEAVGLILELIGKPEGKKIFVKTAPSCELYRSLPIAIRAEDGIVTGTIDRLIVEHEDGKPKRARAYQFLTESLSTERQRDLPQSPAVQACRKAAALFLGLELEAVETHVVLLRDGRVV